MTSSTREDRRAEVYQDTNRRIRVRVDAPGIAAVSAEIDPAMFIYEIAKVAGLNVKIG